MASPTIWLSSFAYRKLPLTLRPAQIVTLRPRMLKSTLAFRQTARCIRVHWYRRVVAISYVRELFLSFNTGNR